MIKKFVNIFVLLLFATTTVFSQSGNTEIDSLSNLIKADKEDTTKLKHLNTLGFTIMFQNPDTAIIIGKQALQLATQLLSAHGANEEIKKFTQKGLGKAYGNLGLMYYLKSEYATSLEYQFKSQEIREAIGDKDGLTNTYSNIGIVYHSQFDFPKSLEYYFMALKLNVELGNSYKIAANLNNIGLVYNDQKDYEKALTYYKDALVLNQRLQNQQEIANNLNNIGIVYFTEGNYTKALDYYFKALRVNEEIDNYPESANNLINIGATYFKIKNFDKALEYYSDALDINMQLDNKYGVALNIGNIGQVYMQQKNYAEAEKNLLKALTIAEQIGALESIKENNQYLSTLYKEQGKFELSLKHYEAYTIAKDSIFNDSKSKDIGRLEMKHEIERAEMERLAELAAKEKTALDQLNRRKNLQYSGIVVLLLLITVMVTVLGFLKVKPAVASGVVFFAFLIFFEFMMILLDPTVNRLSGGEPAYSLLLNAAIAAAIFPIHAFFERMLKKRLIREAAQEKTK